MRFLEVASSLCVHGSRHRSVFSIRPVPVDAKWSEYVDVFFCLLHYFSLFFCIQEVERGGFINMTELDISIAVLSY